MKGAAAAGLARASAKRLAASVAVSAEEIMGMTLLWRGDSTVFPVHSHRVYGK